MELWERNRIKELENNSQWADAAIQWRKHNQIQDAEACELIAESNRKADEWRKRVHDQIGDEPNKETDFDKWKQWHNDLMLIK